MYLSPHRFHSTMIVDINEGRGAVEYSATLMTQGLYKVFMQFKHDLMEKWFKNFIDPCKMLCIIFCQLTRRKLTAYWNS
jgi:hypothetical protein